MYSAVRRTTEARVPPFSALKTVVYDLSPSRAREHTCDLLDSSNGELVCDDLAGYKVGFERHDRNRVHGSCLENTLTSDQSCAFQLTTCLHPI